MTTIKTPSEPTAKQPLAAPVPKRDLSPEAQRALAEAEERRTARNAGAAQPAKEVGGRDGPDPARYGDWETGGIASDF